MICFASYDLSICTVSSSSYTPSPGALSALVCTVCSTHLPLVHSQRLSALSPLHTFPWCTLSPCLHCLLYTPSPGALSALVCTVSSTHLPLVHSQPLSALSPLPHTHLPLVHSQPLSALSALYTFPWCTLSPCLHCLLYTPSPGALSALVCTVSSSSYTPSPGALSLSALVCTVSSTHLPLVHSQPLSALSPLPHTHLPLMHSQPLSALSPLHTFP